MQTLCIHGSFVHSHLSGSLLLENVMISRKIAYVLAPIIVLPARQSELLLLKLSSHNHLAGYKENTTRATNLVVLMLSTERIASQWMYSVPHPIIKLDF